MRKKKPLVGVTGIIGSGKSTVAGIFSELSAAVFNADAVAREVTQEEQTLRKIRKEFGDNVIDGNGNLDRAELARVVFPNQKQLQKLNELIHPQVRQQMWRFVKRKQVDKSSSMILIDAPLIFETDLYTYLNVIVVVISSEEACVERIMRRSHFSREEVMHRMNQQIPLSEKIKRADFCINNNSTIESLYPQVQQVYQEILNQWGDY